MSITFDETIEHPVPVTQCGNCQGTIWRQGTWFQCPDCGALSTQFGGLFTHATEPVSDFLDAVNKEKKLLGKI